MPSAGQRVDHGSDEATSALGPRHRRLRPGEPVLPRSQAGRLASSDRQRRRRRRSLVIGGCEAGLIGATAALEGAGPRAPGPGVETCRSTIGEYAPVSANRPDRSRLPMTAT